MYQLDVCSFLFLFPGFLLPLCYRYLIKTINGPKESQSEASRSRVGEEIKQYCILLVMWWQGGNYFLIIWSSERPTIQMLRKAGDECEQVIKLHFKSQSSGVIAFHCKPVIIFISSRKYQRPADLKLQILSVCRTQELSQSTTKSCPLGAENLSGRSMTFQKETCQVPRASHWVRNRQPQSRELTCRGRIQQLCCLMSVWQAFILMGIKEEKRSRKAISSTRWWRFYDVVTSDYSRSITDANK